MDRGESRQSPDIRPLPGGLPADAVQHHVDVGGAMGRGHSLCSQPVPTFPEGRVMFTRVDLLEGA